MNPYFAPFAAAAVLSLAACGGQDASDRLEDQAEASAEQSGDAIVALGMTERQLLDADLVDADGRDLGDIEGVLRDNAGQVDRLLVEIDDTDPDRYVHVPVAGLTTRADGDDMDVQTSMTREELLALPEAELTLTP